MVNKTRRMLLSFAARLLIILIPVHATLLINEFVAINVDYPIGPSGDFDDWIEQVMSPPDPESNPDPEPNPDPDPDPGHAGR